MAGHRRRLRDLLRRPGPDAVARTLAGKRPRPQTVARLIRHRLQLDQPILVQYWLPVAAAARQPGLLVLPPAVRQLGHQAGLPDHALAGRSARRSSGSCSGCCQRRALGGPGRGSCWTGRSPLLALFFYSMPTFVLGLLLLLVFYYQLTMHGIHVLPGPGVHARSPSDPWQWFRGTGPAVDHAGAGLGGRLHPADPRLDARRARRGLHPHGPVQGPDRTPGDLPARAARPRSRRSSASSASTSARCSAAAIITEKVFGMPGLGYTAVQRHRAAGPAGDHRHRRSWPRPRSWSPTSWSTSLYAVLDPRVRLH